MLEKIGRLYTPWIRSNGWLTPYIMINHRLAKDADYFTHKLSSLEDIDPPSNSVIEAVNDISLS